MDSEADESKQGELPARSLWNLGSDPFTQLYSHQVNQITGFEAQARGRILHTRNAAARPMPDLFSASARASKNELQNQLARLESARLRYQQEQMMLARYSLPNMNNLTSPVQAQRRRSLFETDLNGDNQQHLSRLHQLGSTGAQLRNGMLYVNENGIGDVNGGTSAIDSSSEGYIIAPCPARGMSVDHNYKTANFVIYNSINHGDELTCSFQACRNSGVKFRYCSHCKIPVAKRNFNKNHSHIAEDQRNEQRRNSSDTSSVGDSSRSSSNSQRNTTYAIVSGESDNSVSTSQSTFSTDIRKDKTSSSSGLKRKRHTSRHQDESDSRKKLNDEQSMISDSSREESDEEIKRSSEDMDTKKDLWLSLLEKRPSSEDKEALSEWLLNVLATSDQSKLVDDVVQSLKSD